MQFSDVTNKQGIIQKCETYIFGNEYGAISGNADLLATFTGFINDATDDITNAILESDTRWQWDDTNFTNYPIASINLQDGQRDYPLDVTHLKILGVEAKYDLSGDYRPIYNVDTRDMTDRGISPTEFFETDGIPQYFDLQANSIFLYPQPDTSQVEATNGLKIRFQRPHSYFTTADTTKEPGFSSTYHKLVPMIASYYYTMSNDMNSKAQFLDREIERHKKGLQAFMQKRDKTIRPRISVKSKPHK